MRPGVERVDAGPGARSEPERAVARFEDRPRRHLDLLARLGVERRQFVQADRLQRHAVDVQLALVALGEVDEDVGLLQHLLGVGGRRDLLDGVRQLRHLVTGDGAQHAERDQHEADGQRQADHQQLAVDASPWRRRLRFGVGFFVDGDGRAGTRHERVVRRIGRFGVAFGVHKSHHAGVWALPSCHHLRGPRR